MAPTPTAPSVFKRELETWFDGSAERVGYFIVTVNSFLRRWDHQFQNDVERIEYIAQRLDGLAMEWYVGL